MCASYFHICSTISLSLHTEFEKRHPIAYYAKGHYTFFMILAYSRIVKPFKQSHEHLRLFRFSSQQMSHRHQACRIYEDRQRERLFSCVVQCASNLDHTHYVWVSHIHNTTYRERIIKGMGCDEVLFYTKFSFVRPALNYGMCQCVLPMPKKLFKISSRFSVICQ